MSNSIVCTLFEGHYHYGVAALVNSLCKNSFKGTIYAGYRGDLPGWATAKKRNNCNGWPDSVSLSVTTDVTIIFLPLKTDYHLTNYKPDFMLELLKDLVKQFTSIFYFDSDLVIKCKWDFFEQWVANGVAVCEDINSPVPLNHPLRYEWKKIYGQAGIKLLFTSDMYINGGFVGISEKNIDFLLLWKNVQDIMGEIIGGLDKTSDNIKGRNEPFSKTDQDALNIAIGVNKFNISSIGKEAMDFKPGGRIMSHATGVPKPWNKNFFLHALKANPPSAAEKEFWRNVQYPLALFSKNTIRLKQISLQVAAFIGRFYNRN